MMENLIKQWPGGSHIFMNGDSIVPGYMPLISIGYNHRSQKILGFIDAEGSRITEPGVAYLYCYPDNYYNFSIRPVFSPYVIGGYFNSYNVI